MTHGELASVAARDGQEVFIRVIKPCKIGSYFLKVGCLRSITQLVQDPDIPYVAGVETTMPVKFVAIAIPLNGYISVSVQNIPAEVIVENFNVMHRSLR